MPTRPDFTRTATKYAGNPIIPRASLTSWYANQLFDFQAMIDPADATQILIFLSGSTGTAASTITIGYATAPVSNPYAWTVQGQILTASGSGFDAAGVRLGSVVYDSNTFYLFYTAYATDYTDSTIGVATSTDHVSWTRQGQILTATGQGRNDGITVNEPAVIKQPNGTWAMVYGYNTSTTTLPGFRAATASSPTGTWTKAGGGDIYGNDGHSYFYEWHHLCRRPELNDYVLFYERGSSASTISVYQCYAASSPDPSTTFTVLNGGNPLVPFGAGGAWDQYHTATPSVLTRGNGDPVLVGGDYLGYFCGAGDVIDPYYTNKWPPAMVRLQAFKKGLSAGSGRAIR